MSAEKIKSPEAQQLLERAIAEMKTAITEFRVFPKIEDLITSSLQVWTDLKSDNELKKIIEGDIKQKGEMLNSLRMTETGVETVKRRYDPYEWEKHIPVEFKNRTGEWVLERSESLLTLLETFNRHE